MILYYFIVVPLLLGTLIYLFNFRFVKRLAVIIQGLMFTASVYLVVLVKSQGEIVSTLGGWEALAGISLRANTISVVFLMITTLLFLFYFIFGLIEEYVNNLFIFLFIVLQSLIITMFLSSDLFNIYLVVEISTMLVGILIMFKKDSRSIYDGLIYLLTNITGMMFFLLGIGFMYKIFGVLDIEIIGQMIEENPQIRSSLFIPFALLMTGVGLKCAVMPLFSWLPKAHGTPSAPSIVSAVLSGLYVKGGIYLFIRLKDMFEPAIDMHEYFLVIGFVTAIGGVILALMQKDIKLILAYHTISQLGLILAGLNMGSSHCYRGAVLHIFNHALFKSALFLSAGLIVKEYGTRNIYEINGVFKRMPLVSISVIMAILGITGAPLFNGSISKYMMQSGATGNISEAMLILINFGTILSFVKYSRILAGSSDGARTGISMQRRAAVLAMGLLCFAGGILGVMAVNILFDIHIQFDLQFYMQKIMLYLASIFLGYLIYTKVLSGSNFTRKGYSLELSFNSISIAVFSFFVITLFAAKIV